jgi:hypothetical protein
MRNLSIKTVFITIIGVISFCAYSQKRMSTDIYTFTCNCIETEKSYNSLKGSHDYTYLTPDGLGIYLISYMQSSAGDEFLDAIKNSGTYNYQYITFLGVKAITAEIKVNGELARQIAFNKGGYSFTIFIGNSSFAKINSMYKTFISTFKLQKM